MGKHKGGKGGAVVNIASVAGLGLQSSCPVYDGTKFFVVGYSLSISVSFKGKFLRIQSVSRTNFCRIQRVNVCESHGILV